EDDVGACDGTGHGLGDVRGIIVTARHPPGGDAQVPQPRREVRPVGVDDFTAAQLVTYGQDLGAHGCVHSSSEHPAARLTACHRTAYDFKASRGCAASPL